jgi:hypothetical protein
MGDSLSISELRIPVDGGFERVVYRGANVLDIDFRMNIIAIHQFIFGTTAGARFPTFQVRTDVYECEECGDCDCEPVEDNEDLPEDPDDIDIDPDADPDEDTDIDDEPGDDEEMPEQPIDDDGLDETEEELEERVED